MQWNDKKLISDIIPEITYLIRDSCKNEVLSLDTDSSF